VERLRDFIRAQRGAYPRIQPDVDEAASGGRLPEGEVARLNASLDQMESEIRSMEAQMETSDRLVDSQVANLSVLPAEDPLLKDARQAVTDASITVMNLEIQFGDDYPRVIEARARLKIAEERLKQEASGVRKRLTTPQVQAYADLVSVRAKRDELRGQLRDAAARLPLSRDLALQLALLRNEMDAQRQLLQVVLQETLKIRIQTVPGQSHVLIVDKAIPAEKVTPLEAMLAIVLSVAKVLAMTVTLIIAAAALEICYAAGDLLDR
jgi:uncharacterized protein involved in exopolysaccharide biosynthesis